ncbi:MAG: DUF2631 domain-containing protein [Corynebacteriales bacterium]|nr:DUF2631 domain-containing protein [Mycobacteriales bacterium]
MSDEYVTAPDQHKAEPLKIWRIWWIVATIMILLMLWGNHASWMEDGWLIGSAAVILCGLIADAVLRKRGWKS